MSRPILSYMKNPIQSPSYYYDSNSMNSFRSKCIPPLVERFQALQNFKHNPYFPLGDAVLERVALKKKNAHRKTINNLENEFILNL